MKERTGAREGDTPIAFPCGLGEKNEERESNTARKIAQVTLTIPLLPQFHFLALVPCPVRPKPKVSFLGLSLLRNQTETLAMQATLGSTGTVTGDRGKNGQ